MLKYCKCHQKPKGRNEQSLDTIPIFVFHFFLSPLYLASLLFKIKLFGPSWLCLPESCPLVSPFPSLRLLRLLPWRSSFTNCSHDLPCIQSGQCWVRASLLTPERFGKPSRKLSVSGVMRGGEKEGGRQRKRGIQTVNLSPLSFSSCPSTCPASDAASALIVSSSLFH